MSEEVFTGLDLRKHGEVLVVIAIPGLDGEDVITVRQ